MELNSSGVDAAAADASATGAIDDATQQEEGGGGGGGEAVSVGFLQSKIDTLEAEFLGAWQTLELLSTEYLTMWERLETVELLLYQQQATIARLVGTYGETGDPRVDQHSIASGVDPTKVATEANQSSAAAAAVHHLRNGPNCLSDDDDFAAKVEAQLRSLEASPPSHYPSPSRQQQQQQGRLSADEAFYRSLNSAHRDSPSLVSESDNELRMIWECSTDRRGGRPPSEESIGHVFSAQDYLHYRRGNNGSQEPPIHRPPPRGIREPPPPPEDEDNDEEEEEEEEDWVWRNASLAVGTDSARQLREIERVSRKLKRDSQRLQELRERLVQSASAPLPPPPPPPPSVDPGTDLHEQLRLAFLESARQKSARLQQRQTLLQPKAKSLGYCSASSAAAASSVQQQSIYSGSSASASVAATAAASAAPVHIDPLHLGRSNSSENVSPSFSSYLRTTADTNSETGRPTPSNPTSPLAQRKKASVQRSPTPQPHPMAGDQSCNKPGAVRMRSASEETAINNNLLSSSRSPNKSASSGRSPARRSQCLSPTRVNTRSSSMRSDSGVSSLSGNWSSMDPEKSPVSPSKLLSAGHHSSTSLQQLDLVNSAPPPPAPADGQNVPARPSSRLTFETPSSHPAAISPSTRPRSQTSGHGQPQAQALMLAQPHLTTETWNVQGSICSVAAASALLHGTESDSYIRPPGEVAPGGGGSRMRHNHAPPRALARHESTWVETSIDDPFMPSMLDGDWYSPRGVVHPQTAPQHHYRSNTPSPAPGSLPEGHFVPEPANVMAGAHQSFQYPTLTFEPCQDQLIRELHPPNFPVQQTKSAGCSPKQRRRLQSSPISSSRHPHDPHHQLEHQLSSPARLVQTPGQTEFSSSSSIDYYDLYYQTPSQAQQQPCYLERNHSSYSSQEVYLFRNPLPNYEDQSPYEQQQQQGHYRDGQEDPMTPFGLSPSPLPTYTSSSQVIVSQCGYISIAASAERPPTAGPHGHLPPPLSPGNKARSSPRKKIRSAVNQLMPYFNRPKLKNRSVSLPGVDAMDEIDRGHLPHSASGSTSHVGRPDDRSEAGKRFSFSRTSSLPGLKKGKKMIKQLSTIIGGGRKSSSRPGSLQSLPEPGNAEEDREWIGSSSRRPLRTLDVVENHSGASGGGRSFVAYCNEGFDSGNDWDDRDDVTFQMVAASGRQAVYENSVAASPIPASAPMQQQQQTDPALSARRPSGPSSGEFAASRALGRYRRMAAAEAAATTSTSPAETTVESLHPLLPDVTVVSSSSSGQSRPESRRIDRNKERQPSGSDEDASLSLSLNLDVMARHLEEQQQRQQQQDTAGLAQEIFFPKVALKTSPKRSGPVNEYQEEFHDSPNSLPLDPPLPPQEPTRHYLEPEQSRPASIDSAPASPRPLANVNRAAPRWQSTEESIDMDDEWYRYGMMQLEEMERRAESGGADLLAEAARQYNQQTSYGNQMLAVLDELHSRVPVCPSECESGGNKIRPSDVAVDHWARQPKEQTNWSHPSSTVPSVQPPESAADEENDDWAAYASSPNRAGLAAQSDSVVVADEAISGKARRDEDDDDYSSGETSGPDSPQNQSFDEDNEGENELYHQYGGDDVAANTEQPECYEAGQAVDLPTASASAIAVVPPSHSKPNHSASVSKGSDIFPAGNILSAAGSTASNIASSVFSFFTSTPTAKDEEPIEPQPQSSCADANSSSAAGATAAGLSTAPAIAVESPGLVEPGYQEGDDMDALDAEQQKMLKLTAKGSAARWKLVKTLRDKKAETANATAATSPTSNEAVRELRWPSPLFTFSSYTPSRPSHPGNREKPVTPLNNLLAGHLLVDPIHTFWSLRNPPLLPCPRLQPPTSTPLCRRLR